jgi:hypothetical protein
MCKRSGGLLVTSGRLALLAWLRRRRERLARSRRLVMLLVGAVGGSAGRGLAGTSLLRGRGGSRQAGWFAPAAVAARAAPMPASAAPSAAATPTALSAVGAAVGAIAREVTLLAARLIGA